MEASELGPESCIVWKSTEPLRDGAAMQDRLPHQHTLHPGPSAPSNPVSRSLGAWGLGFRLQISPAGARNWAELS